MAAGIWTRAFVLAKQVLSSTDPFLQPLATLIVKTKLLRLGETLGTRLSSASGLSTLVRQGILQIVLNVTTASAVALAAKIACFDPERNCQSRRRKDEKVLYSLSAFLKLRAGMSQALPLSYNQEHGKDDQRCLTRQQALPGPGSMPLQLSLTPSKKWSSGAKLCRS